MRFLSTSVYTVLATIGAWSTTSAADPAFAAPPITVGISSSAEWGGEYPKLHPLMQEAGITSYRHFPEWSTLEPKKGEWNWKPGDSLVASAKASGMDIFGCLHYLAPWASSGGDTRTFPLKNVADWGDFSAATIAHFKNDITYWEVYNEFNGGFAKKGTPQQYAELVQQSYVAGKKANPNARIGIGCADVDISFFEKVIAAGAANHFDFIVVHPYSLMAAAMNGREPVFLRLGDNLRALLKKTNQRDDIELVVTEVGLTAKEADAATEARQAAGLVQGHALVLGQGIGKIYWFEGRGPNYGDGTFGIVRKDWSRRPSFTAMQTFTRLLGKDARRLGWFDPNGKSYGFAFQGSSGPLLISWAHRDSGDQLTFPGAVTVTTLAGVARPLAAGETLALTREPVFITNLPEATIATIRANAVKPFPWLKDYTKVESVSVEMGAANVEDGVVQADQGDGITATGLVDGVYARRTQKNHGKPYMYFDVDDSYAAVGDRELEITITARPVDEKAGAGFNLVCETSDGYRATKDFWTLEKSPTWQTHTFRLPNANFANNWGWNFRIEAPGSASDVWVRQVVVKRVGAKK